MRWMPRLRMFMARRPWLHWVLVAILAAGVAAIVAAELADVRRQRDAWAKTIDVIVAERDVVPGESMVGRFFVRAVPIGLAPSTVLTGLPVAAIATQEISRGEMIVEADIAPERSQLALLPSGWLAIRVVDDSDQTASVSQTPSDSRQAQPMFVVGDAAAILADGAIIAPDAIVLGVESGVVVIGVPSDVAGAVARAVSQRSAVIALAH